MPSLLSLVFSNATWELEIHLGGSPDTSESYKSVFPHPRPVVKNVPAHHRDANMQPVSKGEEFSSYGRGSLVLVIEPFEEVADF